MQLRSLALKFVVQGGIVYPVDASLHRLVEQYAAEQLSAPINFSDYEDVKVIVETDGPSIDEALEQYARMTNEDLASRPAPVRVTGVCCRRVVFDYPVWRGTTNAAMEALIVRVKSDLDERGLRGGEVFVHVADHEPEESRCPSWRAFLKKVRAQKASRWRVTI